MYIGNSPLIDIRIMFIYLWKKRDIDKTHGRHIEFV